MARSQKVTKFLLVPLTNISSRRQFCKMAAWSSLFLKNVAKVDIGRNIINSIKNGPKAKGVNYVPVRGSHDRTLVIRSSTYESYKFKDLVYFYFAIGAIPLVAISLYCNIFIGPATLALPPEGYEPKHWEYHRHPITRFFAKYLTPNPQEHYERTLHNMFYNQEKHMLRELERKVKDLIKERRDYQSWYFDKAPVKYYRQLKKDTEDFEDREGFRSHWVKTGGFY